MSANVRECLRVSTPYCIALYTLLQPLLPLLFSFLCSLYLSLYLFFHPYYSLILPHLIRAHASKDRCPFLHNSLSCQCPTLHPSVRQTQNPLSTSHGSCWDGFLSFPSLASMVDNLRSGMCHACTDHSLTAFGYSDIHQPTGMRGAPLL
jgi:hypothetical protein